MGEAAERVYQRFVGRVARNLVRLGASTEPDHKLAEAAIEAVRRAVRHRGQRPHGLGHPPPEPPAGGAG
jgi:hypothetical protein